jgi:endonuclease/exonuclease/phosphatase family metal-dependent hydrolase
MIRPLLLAVMAAFSTLASPAAAREQLRVMSFNVRYPAADDGANRWEQRRDIMVATIRRAAPDVIGTQELFQTQGDYLVRALPHYAWFGRDRRGGHGDEHMGILYRRDRLTLVRSGDFWLSDTPDVVGSISWGHPLPRMVNWGEFRTRGGTRFFLFDTHLPYRDEDEPAREKGARLIAAKIGEIAGDAPVVLTGDFNTVPSSRTHAVLAERLRDAREAAPRVSGPAETFHGFTGKADRRIDWVFVRGFGVERYATVTDAQGGRYPSDHFPVLAELTLP